LNVQFHGGNKSGGKVHWQFRGRLLNAQKLKLAGFGENSDFFLILGANPCYWVKYGGLVCQYAGHGQDRQDKNVKK